MNLRRAVPACLLLLTGCAPPQPLAPPQAEAAASANVLVSARLGERASAGGLRLTPLRIQEDSRCPADATCVQAGTLRLEARLESESVTAHRLLTLDQPISFAGRRVELVAGCPYPLASRPVPPAERRFVFAVGTSERDPPANPPDYCA